MSRKPFIKTVRTRGKKIDGMPFMGEAMTCIMCGKAKTSDPAVESNWRMLEVDGRKFYACNDEFPPDATATKEDYAAAYNRVLRKIIRILQGGMD